MPLLSPIITKSGWIFGQSSLHHPPGYVRGYPMYFPADSGNRIFRGESYSKYSRLQSGVNESAIPPYPKDPIVDPWSVIIPVDEIIEKIDCLASFRSWRRNTDDPRHSVVESILRRASIPLYQVGLIGSMALGCPDENPDLDLLIHGSSYVAPCIREIEKLLHRGEVSFMSEGIAELYARKYSNLYNFPYERMFQMFRLDLTKIYVAKQKISVIFVYDDKEINSIPDSLYADCDKTETEFDGTVVTGFSSWLYPRHYLVMTDSGILYSVWSHHWIYKGIASAGSKVHVRATDVGNNILLVSSLRNAIFPI